MRSFFSFLLCIVFSSAIFAQTEPEKAEKTEKAEWAPRTIGRLSLLTPGIMLEIPFSPSITIVPEFWLSAYFYSQSINGVVVAREAAILPFATLEPRFYVTQARRRRLGLRTDRFSGGYIGVPLTVGFATKSFGAGVQYGFQRALGRVGYWNIGIGLGLNPINAQVGLIGDFGLGFVLDSH